MTPYRGTLLLACAAALLVFTTCGSVTIKEDREKEILDKFTPETRVKYEDLLVELESYTTDGDRYQRKYQKLLIGIAGDLIEEKEMTIAEHSIGFYYDKKSGDTEKLYLGLDIDSGRIASGSYPNVVINLLQKDLDDIIETLNSCRSILYEDNIIGLVIGWKWTSGAVREQVNIWISKDNVLRFEDNRLTLEELIQRSTVTNTEGKIIRLLI